MATADFYNEPSQIPIFLKEIQKKTGYLCKQCEELFREFCLFVYVTPYIHRSGQ